MIGSTKMAHGTNIWERSLSKWTRTVQKLGDVVDEETGKRELVIEHVPVTMIRETLGATSIFAENEQVLEGLRRVHIYAAR